MSEISSTSTGKTFTLLFLGDIMLGRLVDQLLPQHVDEPEDAAHAASFLRRNPDLKGYSHLSPWGNTLPLLQSSDLVLGNLETSATTHNVKWPDKVFNYRMHPDNVASLTEAGIDYVCLANNHTLDYCEDGLQDTIRTVKKAGIRFAGAGETEAEARAGCVLSLPGAGKHVQHEVHCYAYSDHPSDWRGVREFNSLHYTPEFREKVKADLNKRPSPALKVVSIHWGPNYAWHPNEKIVEMAHFLIDDCGVDIVYGTSSHHIQGVEVYNGKLVIYGCGDFVDDYALVEEFRNDLSAGWRVSVRPKAETNSTFELVELEVFPTRNRHFHAELLDRNDPDHGWVNQKFRELCQHHGTIVEEVPGNEGQIVVDLKQKHKEER